MNKKYLAMLILGILLFTIIGCKNTRTIKEEQILNDVIITGTLTKVRTYIQRVVSN